MKRAGSVLAGTARLRGPRRVQRCNQGVNRTLGVICSARCHAGGDAAARRPYLAENRSKNRVERLTERGKLSL